MTGCAIGGAYDALPDPNFWRYTPMRAALFSLLLLLLVLPAWAEEPADGASATLTAYARLVNERQFDQLGQLFADDVDYRSESWVHVKGVEAITTALREACEAKPGLRLEIEAGDVRQIASNVAQVDGRYSLRETSDATPLTGGMTVTCVQSGATWKIATLRDWADVVTRRDGLFHSLDWMMGSWEGESMDVPFRVNAALTPGGGFVHFAMEFGAKDEEPTGISTLFGFDASTNTVRSWHFLNDGGTGSGTWTVGAREMVGKVRFVTGDGVVIDSVRRLALADDGSLVVETTERHVGDQVLPALETIVLKRVTTEPAANAAGTR